MKNMSTKTTKRRRRRTYGWLKTGILTTSIAATLAGGHILNWQDSQAAEMQMQPSLDNGLVVEQQAPEPELRIVRTNTGTFLLELPPVATVVAAPPSQSTESVAPALRRAVPSSVARSRSSR